MRPAIERSFRLTRHQISFGQFLPEVLADYDVLVPLNMPDVRRLAALRGQIAHSLLPVPSEAVISICDDKLQFNRMLVERGFGDFTPALIDEPEPPYVLKRRTDFGGRHTHVIRDPDSERALIGDLPVTDYLRQALIPGPLEYASHVLFLGNRVVRSLTFEYDMGQPTAVKGHGMRPVRQRMVSCRHRDTFGAILQLIGFEGLCCIDYKVHAGRPLIMEVNPRFGGSLCPYFFAYLRDIV